MSRFTHLHRSLAMLVIGLAALITVRYTMAWHAGVSHQIAVRTYVFWALVCVPVALLGDLLVRTIANYRVTRLTVERIKTRR